MIKGTHHSPEARKKMALAKTGKNRSPLSEITKKKISLAHQGKARLFLRDKPLSKEHKQKISQGLKGKVPWNKGKHYSHQPKKYQDLKNFMLSYF